MLNALTKVSSLDNLTDEIETTKISDFNSKHQITFNEIDPKPSNDSNFGPNKKNTESEITATLSYDEKKYQFLRLEENIEYIHSNIKIGSVDVPEFIPRFLTTKDQFLQSNLKISSSLPNISESSEIPEFYPKDYPNVPKKAASVYDKPLRNVKIKLPENTSNTINGQDNSKITDRFKFEYSGNEEKQIPVVNQRPRDVHKFFCPGKLILS